MLHNHGEVTNSMTVKIKVCAYCRVSTNSKDQENSYENQHSFFQRLFSYEENNKYELYKVYADKGISGTSLNKREQFLNMLFDAGVDHVYHKGKIVFVASDREPLFHRIFVSNASRFARNVLSIDIIRELRKKNVYIEFMDCNLNTETADEFQLILFLSLAQNDSIDKSKKVRFGLRESARKGVIFTNGNIYGYRYHSHNNSLEVIPEEAEVVVTVFELYNQGLGVRRIINTLNERGYTTRKGKEFSPSMIKRMISQEKYCGDLARNKYDTGEVFNKHSYAKLKPRNEWIIHKDVIPAIVSREVFNKAQAIRDSKESSTGQRGVYKGKSEYAGLIVCDNCKQMYTRNIDRGRVFYNCSTKKSKGTKACNNVNVQLYQIEEIMDALQNGLLYDLFLYDKETKIKQLEEILERVLATVDKQATNIVDEHKERYKQLEEEKRRLARLYMKGTLKEEQLDEMSLELDNEIESVQAIIKEASKSNEEIYAEAKEITDTIVKLKSLELKTHYTYEELRDLLKCITVSRDTQDHRLPFLGLEFKVFDLINRITEKYKEIHLEQKEHFLELPRGKYRMTAQE